MHLYPVTGVAARATGGLDAYVALGPPGRCSCSRFLVYNQGSAETDPTETVTRVVFSTTSGPVQVPSPDAVDTSPLAAGGSQLVEFAIPANCISTTGYSCDFSIGVDATNSAESNEGNNNAAGSCVFIF